MLRPAFHFVLLVPVIALLGCDAKKQLEREHIERLKAAKTAADELAVFQAIRSDQVNYSLVFLDEHGQEGASIYNTFRNEPKPTVKFVFPRTGEVVVYNVIDPANIVNAGMLLDY